MPFCRECGSEVTAAMKFCPECAAPQATQSVVANVQDSVVAGDNLSKELELKIQQEYRQNAIAALEQYVTEFEDRLEYLESVRMNFKVSFFDIIVHGFDSKRARNYRFKETEEGFELAILKSFQKHWVPVAIFEKMKDNDFVIRFGSKVFSPSLLI